MLCGGPRDCGGAAVEPLDYRMTMESPHQVKESPPPSPGEDSKESK